MSSSPSHPTEIRDVVDPTTGRRLKQLTFGNYFDHALYYFDHTFAADDKTLVFQRFNPLTGEIQLYSIDTQKGALSQLTKANTANSLWRPYLQPPGFGIRELLSAINRKTDDVIYFNNDEIRAVNIHTHADRRLASVPQGRVPCGLTSVSPDGRYFCYPHYDRKWHEMQIPPASKCPERWMTQDTHLELLDLQTGASHELLRVNFWITHSNFVDDSHLVFCHNATDHVILLADINRPSAYEVIRTADRHGQTNHYGITCGDKLFYEVLSLDAGGPVHFGIYTFSSRERCEYELDLPTTRVHVGRDYLGKHCIFEASSHDGDSIYFYPHLSKKVKNKGVRLIGNRFSTFSNNQRSHFHPTFTADGKWILFNGGDLETRTNHLYLLDASDLPETIFE
jgi:hypothetical protein